MQITKKTVVGIVIVIILIAIIALIFNRQGSSSQPQEQSTTDISPDVVSTKPSPLDDSTILPTQGVEITFNTSLESATEVKYRLEPNVEVNLELSEDKKTLKITPKETFELGASYTLFILPDTKLEDKKTFGKEKVYHFKTIDFKSS